MLDNFSILTISPFVGILNEATKSVAKCFKKDINRYIPIFSLVYGVILGIAGYYIPDLDFGHNLVEAIFAGLVGGGAATGVHQTFHQSIQKHNSFLHYLYILVYILSVMHLLNYIFHHY